MSGICGAWAFDGGDPGLGPVLALLERRGPDGTRSWDDGPVALGHTLLATTPEALVEKLPLIDQASGCTITADARIDNREELIAALDLGSEARTIGDGELILRAYLKWNEDCPKHLLGDFAFAIWDPRERRLFCARDHMGMRQFNYCHRAAQTFVFATEDTAVLAHHSVPGDLNEGRIADFIADLEGYDFTSTFFEHIRRLAPAHSLTVDAKRCEIRRYWTLRPGPRLHLDSNKAYGEAFLEVFTEAVRCRLRRTGGLGAMLSGGLDSSAVVAVAAGILSDSNESPLRTISAVGPNPSQCPETTAIQSVLTIDGVYPIFVGQSDFDELGALLIAELNDVRNPFQIHGTMLRGIYFTARANGMNVVLDGGAGDVVLTSNNKIASLLKEKRFTRSVQEAKAESLFWKTDRPLRYVAEQLLSAAWVAHVPVPIRARRRKFRLSRPFAEVEPGFAKRVRFADRRLIADGHICMTVNADAERRAQSILHPNLTAGRERYDQLAGAFGVESRDPFMDIRLIEFCLSLPPDQLQEWGWPKIILRRAIETMVPHNVAWRRGKEHLGWDFTIALLERWSNWQEAMCEGDSPLVAFLSKRSLRDLRTSRNQPPTGLTLRQFALDRFLRRYGNGPRGH